MRLRGLTSPITRVRSNDCKEKNTVSRNLLALEHCPSHESTHFPLRYDDNDEDELFPEPQTTSISSRTGGFEVPSAHYGYPLDDEMTLQSGTVYTDGNAAADYNYTARAPSGSDTVTLRSQATTVKMGTKRGSVIDVDDIQPEIQRFKESVRRGWAEKLVCSPGLGSRIEEECGDDLDDNDSCCSSLSSHPVKEIVTAAIPPAIKTSQSTETSKRDVVHKTNGNTPAPVTVSILQKSRTKSQSNNETPQRRKLSDNLLFSFQYNSSGAGVEVHDKRLSASTGSAEKAKQNKKPSCVSVDGDDNISWCLNSPSKNHRKVVVDDEDLMKRCTSPGVIRLTAEGLEKHQHHVVNEPRSRTVSETSLEAWKINHFEQRSRQKQKQKNEDDMEKRAMRRAREQALRRRAESDPFSEFGYSERGQHSSSQQLGSPKRANILNAIKSPFKKEDVSDVSLAPLNEVAKVATPVTDQSSRPGLLGRFRRSPSQAAQAILEKERKSAEEAMMRKMIVERQEKERIERKRQAYLDYQRALEKEPAGNLPAPLLSPRTRSRSSFTKVYLSNYLIDDDADARTGTTHDLSTLSSKSSASALPPCKVCGKGERTHIASPCMHFAFCGLCADRLGSVPKPVCPICAKDTTFACVSV